MKINFHEEIRSNKIKSGILIFFFVIVIGLLGGVVGLFYNNFAYGFFLAIIFGAIYTTIAFSSGGSWVLSMSKAKAVTKAEYPHLFHTIEGLAIAAGIPTPKAYVIEDSALNAFATGKNPKCASITVTTGLLQKLNREELEGVVAHEMSHIKNYDIRVMLLTAVLVGIVVLLSDFLLRSFIWGKSDRDRGNSSAIFIVLGIALAILAPLIGELIKLAVSRRREYLADANGAILTRYPQGLANALKKIRSDPDPLVDNANKATAHLFISTPFRKKKSFVTSLFSTHPPIDERIKRLEQM